MSESVVDLETANRLAEALGDPRAIPDVEWLERLLGVGVAEITSTLRELEKFEDLERMIHVSQVAGGRDFYAQFRAPFELYTLVRLLRPQHVIETGVSSGVSSAHLLLGLKANGTGKLHSIDFPVSQKGLKLARSESPVSLPPGKTSGWAIPSELKIGWDLRLGPSQTLLPPLVGSLPSVGLFLHDSLHTPAHLTFELNTVLPKLQNGAIVLADNTQWTGRAFDRFAAKLNVPFYRRADTDLVGLRFPGPALPTKSPKASGGTLRKRAPPRHRN